MCLCCLYMWAGPLIVHVQQNKKNVTRPITLTVCELVSNFDIFLASTEFLSSTDNI